MPDDLDVDIAEDKAAEGGPDELDEGDLEELAEETDLDVEVEDEDEDEEAEVLDEALDDAAVDAPVVVVTPRPVKEDEDEDEDDLDEEPDSDDVEASLDVILKERLVVSEDEDEDEDETPEPDDRGEATGRVLPKQPGEFVCQSCFLVKKQTQLADPARMMCLDCV